MGQFKLKMHQNQFMARPLFRTPLGVGELPTLLRPSIRLRGKPSLLLPFPWTPLIYPEKLFPHLFRVVLNVSSEYKHPLIVPTLFHKQRIAMLMFMPHITTRRTKRNVGGTTSCKYNIVGKLLWMDHPTTRWPGSSRCWYTGVHERSRSTCTLRASLCYNQNWRTNNICFLAKYIHIYLYCRLPNLTAWPEGK